MKLILKLGSNKAKEWMLKNYIFTPDLSELKDRLRPVYCKSKHASERGCLKRRLVYQASRPQSYFFWAVFNLFVYVSIIFPLYLCKPLHLILISDVKSLKRFKMNNKGWKRPQKVFQPAFVCMQHPKAGQNTQQAAAHGDLTAVLNVVFSSLVCFTFFHSKCSIFFCSS